MGRAEDGWQLWFGSDTIHNISPLISISDNSDLLSEKTSQIDIGIGLKYGNQKILSDV